MENSSRGVMKICANGHQFYKKSDCPVCPQCEAQKNIDHEFLCHFAAPARRALAREGILSIEKLAAFKEIEISQLHGIGSNALKKMKELLAECGLQFT